MKHGKEHYKQISFNGFSWYAFEKGVHFFSKKEGNFWLSIKCSEDQIENGDLEFMCEHGLQISNKKVKEIQNTYTNETR